MEHSISTANAVRLILIVLVGLVAYFGVQSMTHSTQATTQQVTYCGDDPLAQGCPMSKVGH